MKLSRKTVASKMVSALADNDGDPLCSGPEELVGELGLAVLISEFSGSFSETGDGAEPKFRDSSSQPQSSDGTMGAMDDPVGAIGGTGMMISWDWVLT